MLTELDTLNKLFDGHMNGTPIPCTGTCCDCGSSVAIKMEKVAAGYGLQGGALHEMGNWQFVVRCETCHQTSSKPDDVGKSAETPVDGALMDVTFFRCSVTHRQNDRQRDFTHRFVLQGKDGNDYHRQRACNGLNVESWFQ